MPDEAILYIIKGYGPTGMAFGVLLFAIYKLVMRNEQLTDKYMDLALKLTETIEANTRSRNKMTEVFEQLRRSIEDAVVLPRRIGRRTDDS